MSATLLLLICSYLLGTATKAMSFVGDATGTWNAAVTRTAQSGGSGCSTFTYWQGKMEIRQSGDTVTYNVGGLTIQGTVNGGTYSSSYVQSIDGLNITDTDIITTDSPKHATGTWSKSWTEGDSQCLESGVTELTWVNEIHRFYNTGTGTHFYTASVEERDIVTNTFPQFNYEGVAFTDASDYAAPDIVSVYRFYNSATATHFYTISLSERDYILAKLPGFSFEGVAYQAHATNSAGTKALHRFFNTQTGTHFFTTFESEKQNIQNTLSQYQYEGIGYYVE